MKNGTETRITLEANSAPDYREKLQAELAEIAGSEMWRAGSAVRSLRPDRWKKPAKVAANYRGDKPFWTAQPALC